MNGAPDFRLQRLLGGEPLAALRRRLRRHFERTEPNKPAGVVRLSQLSSEEHEALASLMGRPPRGFESMLIDVGVIDTALQRAGIAASLRDALERLEGAIVHRASARAELEARWSAVAAGARHPALAAYLRAPAGLGLLKRLARQHHGVAARLREDADAVLQRLPAHGLPLAQLAAEALGNAHALDSGQPLATLVLAAWRLHDAPPDADAANDASEMRKEERARDVWARAGILVNELARPTLILNLPVQNRCLTMPRAGEPAYVSLRLLVRTPPAFAVAGREVYVCENPSVVAIAADRLGSRCAPLVCTEGMPAAAQRSLLVQLSNAGARLLYHGDFDWPGVRIANHVIHAYGAQAWRLGAMDYERALASTPRQKHELTGAPVPASWSDALAPTMQIHRVAIPEEALAASLLQDLQG
jgi:uncharacterized protein (TIGR02679 family)